MHSPICHQSAGIIPEVPEVIVKAILIERSLWCRTQPHIVLVLDSDKQHYPSYDKVNLREYNLDNPDYARIIKKALGVGAFDLDPNKIIESAGSSKGKGWRKFF